MLKEFEKSIAPWLGKTMKLIEHKIESTLEANNIDLSKMHFLLLKSVQERPGICQSELAFFTNKNKSSLARVINTLEKKNYIARIPSKNDKRMNQLHLTKKGAQMIEQAKPHFLGMAKLIETDLTKEEITTMIQTLKKIQKNVAGEEIGFMLNDKL